MSGHDQARLPADASRPGSATASASPAVRRSASAKLSERHLDKLAIVYVRQSTPQQIFDHKESRERQYALADYAAALGWPEDRVLVIDEDQGQSGRTAERRLGFQRLLAEVTMDHVGLVLGLELSRLSRSSKDWYHLLELCAVFGTLLADQDGLYDPNDTNDRLVLGLKGTMSEIELITMRNRLERGKLHKAERGELILGVPCGTKPRLPLAWGRILRYREPSPAAPDAVASGSIPSEGPVGVPSAGACAAVVSCNVAKAAATTRVSSGKRFANSSGAGRSPSPDRNSISKAISSCRTAVRSAGPRFSR